MSTRPDSFSEEDAFSGEAATEAAAGQTASEQVAAKQNGRPDPWEEADRHPDFPLTPDRLEKDDPVDVHSVQFNGQPSFTERAPAAEPVDLGEPDPPAPILEEPLFQGYEFVPPPPPPRRKPDFADCVLFALLAAGAFFCSGLLMLAAIHYHLFGVSTLKQAYDEIHYRIGSQAAWYIITLLFCLPVFRLAWRRNFFEGLQWRGEAAANRIWRLVGAASACFIAAIVDELVMPGPTNTPIDQTFRMPGAVWLLFGFGVTLAPLIEEIAYRGLLLPALCTAYDWTREEFTHSRPRPPGEDGFPRWSTSAMVFGSVVVSVPFALMHGEQTAYSVGPFLLLVCISLVLCWVRLAVRSLAASVVVHSSYNLLLFSLMFMGTGGFKHLDKM